MISLGDDNDKKKIPWVSWKLVMRPTKNGGLGVGCLNSLNLSLIATWWWGLNITCNDLWCMCNKTFQNLFTNGNLLL